MLYKYRKNGNPKTFLSNKLQKQKAWLYDGFPIFSLIFYDYFYYIYYVQHNYSYIYTYGEPFVFSFRLLNIVQAPGVEVTN